MRARMEDAHARLCVSLVALHARFAGDGAEVQAEWLAFLQRADAALLEALTACLRRSLHEVARVLQGDSKRADAVSPTLALSVILDTNGRWAPWLRGKPRGVGQQGCRWCGRLSSMPGLQPRPAAGWS